MLLANVFNYFPPAAMVANTIILGFIFFGLAKRHQTRTHVRVMVSCFVLDVLNVVVVELGARLRDKAEGDPNQSVGAVEEGMKNLMENPLSLLNFHVLVSTIAIVCYVVAVFTGRRLLRSELQSGRRAHKANAAVFLLTRIASWITSFLV